MLRNLLILIILLQGQNMFSQDTITQKKDVKVGLVLSGGGAKGFAYVGVLKVLEEAGVRLDYIGGTSMGAIIGALYASGYNANELDSIMNSYNFIELMQDKLPRKSKSVYQKENTEKYALTLPLKNGKVALPSALSKGQNVFNMLSELTEHVHDVDDFTKLPIPFFCVATNLENGEQEVLETGFLPEVIRASGSFPTLLDPVEIDGKLLTDGGVVNNFPVDIMRQKDVDIIIGIDVQDNLKDKEELNSAPNILMQIVNFQMYDGAALKLKDVDLYMHPDISDYTVVSFDLTKEIIDKGEEVARKQIRALQEISERQVKNKTSDVKKAKFLKKEMLFVSDIKISGNKNYTKEYILDKIDISETGYITHKKFIEGINSLSATGNFKSIYYKFVQRSKGTEIHLKLIEEEVITFLQLSAHFDDLFKTGVLLNMTSKHLLIKNDVISADLILGDNVRYNFDYFIDNGFHWSYGINSSYNTFDKAILRSTFDELPITEIDNKTTTKYFDFTTQLFVQTSFTNSFALRLGAESKYLRIFTEDITNNETIRNFYDNNTYVNAFAEIKVDTYDKSLFPKKGFYLDVNYKGYLYSSNNFRLEGEFNPFTQLKGKLGLAYTIRDRFTTHLISEAGVTIGENNNKVHNFHLGGYNENFINNFTSFYGYDVGGLSESAFLKSTLTFRYELFEKNYLSFAANAARVDSDIFNRGDIFEDTKLGYAAGYGIESIVGPIEIKYTWSPDTSQNIWFFNIGFWF